MYFAELCYRLQKKPVPYFAKYSLMKILTKPIRKFLMNVIIPNIPFNRLRVRLYRLSGVDIGKRVFIGMKCYLDDVDPWKIHIEDDVGISFGVYIINHGTNQGHTHIYFRKYADIGARCTLISGKNGLEIGEHAIIGACSLVLKNVPPNTTSVGSPSKVIKNNLK